MKFDIGLHVLIRDCCSSEISSRLQLLLLPSSQRPLSALPNMATGGCDLLPSVQTLLQNPQHVFMETSEVLLRIGNNILENPGIPKYRRLKVSNATITQKLLPVCGAVECLIEMGFQEDGEFFSLPEQASLHHLTLMKDQLEMSRRNGTTTPAGATGGAETATPSPSQPASQIPMPASLSASLHPLLLMQREFFKKLVSGQQTVSQYEDIQLQAKARSSIPIKKLEDKALKRWEVIGGRANQQDIFLLELLNWFKKEFFQWVDSPKCDHCQGATENIGIEDPTPDELLWGAARVENYICVQCNQHTRFPRYNHAGKLLDIRQGRCGEWANCFTLCCRAVGFEARYVMDWTDHVWTEVYSEHQKRWLHCDACENVCDKPLLYETGWNKKLSYIVAFSKDDIQDVTWRYTSTSEQVLKRRTKCSEAWLLLTMFRIRQRLSEDISERRKKELLNRYVVELVEFLSVKTLTEGEQSGRVSGSLAWRELRGETKTSPAVREPNVIKPTKKEQENKFLHLGYCCSTDKYQRPSTGEECAGWQSLIWESTNIFRKEESDWKMVYLARTEEGETASISWKFDLTGTSLVVDKIEVMAESATYESGQVMWRICGDQQSAFLPPGGSRTVVGELSGSQTVVITAHLRGGIGSCAWQHTQLFRQAMDDTTNCPLDVHMTFKSKE